MNCPLCGSDCMVKAESKNNYIKFRCKEYHVEFVLGSSIDCGNKVLQNRLENLVFEHIMKKNYSDDINTPWWFFYEPTYLVSEKEDINFVNLADVHYPDTLSEKIDRILLNLSVIKPDYGVSINLNPKVVRAFFPENENDKEKYGIIKLMTDLGYLYYESVGNYRISADGWKRIDELSRRRLYKQGFIAISFSDEAACIKEAIKKSISNAKFFPMVINEKEHNGQIVPEIFYEIDNSSFLVMDVTYPNNGAYYEAGYALGKEKQVIICCSKESFENKEKALLRPHFDIAQKSMVIWNSLEDLIEKLEKRIRATVK